MATIQAEFEVPAREATGLSEGGWFWTVSSWPGVKAASLDGTLALLTGGRHGGTLEVEASPRAMKRVRAFCKARGYKELLPEEV